ncbi:MAG: 50S ribosomal protein L15 [Deltaproteobacteria bacterium]|nr:50S ribosomal protein L15 [Deltaproteobacteria bacterium]
MVGNLSPVTRRKKKKRLGRGDASGHGGTSTKGHKGQTARAGGYHKVDFEGGQTPMMRRLPKRGFTNIFRKRIGIVNLEQLALLPKGTEVTLDLAKEKGWVSNKAVELKILGVGDLKHPLTIKAGRVSKSAKQKIEAAGGNVAITL